MHSSEKIEELVTELEGYRWDAILLNETWRHEPAELWSWKIRQQTWAEITTEELQSAISKLKTGKSPDDIKACDDETREMVRQLFNEIIKRNNFRPDEWKKVRIKVIHKKGDVENEQLPPDLLITCDVQNCSRQFCTEDYTQCLTKNKQKIRRASEKLTRQRTTLQHTD